MPTSLLGLLLVVACSPITGGPIGTVPLRSPASAQQPAPCRIPFTDFKTTGFISYPDGAFKADPGAAVKQDPDRPGFAQTVASPILSGYGGTGIETYDWKFSRWLPVSSELVTADGSQYTYSESIPNPASQGIGGPPPLGTLVHLVDVATGQDHVAYQSTDVLDVAAIRPEGIYLFQPTVIANTFVPFYVWLMDPATHTAHKVLGGNSAGPGLNAFAAGMLWIMATDPNNPKGTPTLVRVDLTDGSQSTWFEPTSAFAQFLGLDALGHPVVSTFSGANGDPGQTWMVTAPTKVQPIANQGFNLQAVADGHGLWLTGNGVFLYPPGGPIRKVSAVVGGSILGSCG